MKNYKKEKKKKICYILKSQEIWQKKEIKKE